MATLTAKQHPGSRRDTGNDLLARAKSASVSAVKDRLQAFSKAHAAFLKADDAVQAADRAAITAQAKLGEADAVHDECVESLAKAAIGEGANRTSPFKAWKGPTTTELKAGAAVPSAKASKRLAGAITKDKTAGKQTKGAAVLLDKAAAGVITAAGPLEAALEKRRVAIAARDGLASAWEKTFAVLKRGARAASDDSKNAGLFDALFAVSAGEKKSPKKAKAAKAAGGNVVPGDAANG